MRCAGRRGRPYGADGLAPHGRHNGVMIVGRRRHRLGRDVVLQEIQRFVMRMAEENLTWGGYTRIQGALTIVGRRVGWTTIARLLRAHGLPTRAERPTS